MRILDVIEDIGLGDAQVFEQMPEGIGQVGRLGIVMRWREAFDRAFKKLVRLARSQGVDKLMAQVLVIHGGFSPGYLLNRADSIVPLR